MAKTEMCKFHSVGKCKRGRLCSLALRARHKASSLEALRMGQRRESPKSASAHILNAFP